jgi:hypothetical protein
MARAQDKSSAFSAPATGTVLALCVLQAFRPLLVLYC